MKFEPLTEYKYIDMGYSRIQEKVTEKIEMHFIELPKFEKLKPGTTKRNEQWLWLITGKEEEKIEMAEKKNKEIKKAVKELDIISMNDKERELYEEREKAIFDYNMQMELAKRTGLREGFLEGREEGKEEGRKEGREEGREEGKKEGKEEGIREGKKAWIKEEREKTIKNMLKMNLDEKIIEEIVGVSRKEIERIKRTIKNS